MKIQLERTHRSCPNQLTCVVCHETFWVRKIRTLLYSNNHLIQGDVCPECAKLNTLDFQQQLTHQANKLFLESKTDCKHSPELQQRAIELLETAQEPLHRPTIFHWLWKKMEIFSEESQELEAARLGSIRCPRRDGLPSEAQNPYQLRILFSDYDSQENL